MLKNIEVLCHSSIRIDKEKIIYVDPFKIDNNYNDADMIFITHDHYDHYSEDDIDKVKKEGTIIIAPEELLTKLLVKGYNKNDIVTVEPNKQYTLEGIKFETIKWKRGIAMKFSNYIMSQSSKDIDKFSRKFSNILN